MTSPTIRTTAWRSAARLTLAAVALGAAALGLAQQDVQYTQFMYDKLTVNPAYAGAKGFPSANVIARQQWRGFAGAPASQALRFHTPFRESKIGLGLRLQNDVIGPTRATSLGGAYAYHLPVGDGVFASAGLDASAMQYRIDWSQLYGADDEPGAELTGQQSRIVGNAGVGGMVYSDKFYVGVSAPRVLRNRLSAADDEVLTEGKEALHVYAMAGYDFRLNADLHLQPNAQVKYTRSAPASADVNATLVWRRLLGLGVSYRTAGALTESIGESIDVLVSVTPNRRLTVGAAYDYTLTDIGGYTSGSYELMIGYVFSPQTDLVRNPRYF